MGHAHHFLSRLDRVSLPHVELALSLYRDEDLLRFIIESTKISTQIPRLAISLDDPTEGPFLVVTRDGKFVTCLGTGMSSGDLPVITRGQLDALGTKAHVLRERLDEAKQLAQGRGVRGLVRRIYDVADEMTREEFIALSALQPLYGEKFFHLYLDAGIDLDDARQILIPILRKTEKPKAVFHDALHNYWKTLWAMGNLAMLAGFDGANGLDEKIRKIMMEESTFSWVAVRQGIVPIALRGIWVAARIGKSFLAGYKQRYRQAVTLLQTVDTGAALMAIGSRHARLRAEVEKALGGEVSDVIKGTPEGRYMEAIRNCASVAMNIDRGELNGTARLTRIWGASLAVALSKQRPMPGFDFKKAEEVPPDIAFLMTTNAFWSFLGNAQSSSNALVTFFGLVPLVARCAPEDLYLTRETMRALHSPWNPEQTLAALRLLREHEYPRGGTLRPEGPSRKGPCPCGSGKKYKRCCGEGKEDAEG